MKIAVSDGKCKSALWTEGFTIYGIEDNKALKGIC